MSRAALLLTLCLCTIAREVGAEDGWEPIYRQDGIEVHRRTVQGSRLLEFRGRGVIDAPAPRLLAVLRDAERRTEWTDRCVESRLIEQVSPRVQISYNRTSAPWPVKDRDVVLRGETQVDPAGRHVRIAFHAVTDPRAPPRPQAVRMPALRGHWLFTPIDGGRRTHAEYQVLADPGGALPTWMANLAARQLPYQTIQGMRRQAQRRTYPEFEAWIRQQPEYQSFVRGATAP